MKKSFAIVLMVLIFTLFASQSAVAKTTLNASFKKHSITINDSKANQLIDMASESFMPLLKDTMKDELTDIIIEELIGLIEDDLMDLLTESSHQSGTPDLIIELIEMINGYLKDETASLQDSALTEIEKSVISGLDSISYTVKQKLPWGGTIDITIHPFKTLKLSAGIADRIVMPLIDETVEDLIAVELPILIEAKLPAIAGVVIEEIPEILIGIVENDIRPMYSALVDAEIPIIVEDLVYKYLPRNLDLNVASLDLKTDINEYFAIGGGLKAISILNVFIPEVSLSTYLKLVNGPRFDMGLMMSGQLLFLPRMDDIYALNAGVFLEYQLSESFFLEGELMVGVFVSDPFGLSDTIPIVGGYNLNLVFDVTDHLHVKAGFSLNGFSELAVTGLKYFLMDKLDVGTFNFSVGCHF